MIAKRGCDVQQIMTAQQKWPEKNAGQKTIKGTHGTTLKKSGETMASIRQDSRKNETSQKRTSLELDRARLSGKIGDVMRPAVITGYIVASAFALCGLVNSVQFCLYGRHGTVGFFVNGLLIAIQPLAMASIIFLLAQILVRMGQQHSSNAGGSSRNRPSAAKAAPARVKQDSSQHRMPERYFPIREDSPIDNPPVTNPDEDASPESKEDLHFFKLH